MSIAMLLFAFPAAGQALDSFEPFPGRMLETVPGTYMENGVGAPSVVWDANSNRFLMAFEMRLPETDPACPVGRWGIGMATSPDGINWTPRPTPVLEPGGDTFYSCVAAHPSAIFDTARNTVHVFFKSEQMTDACDRGTPAWGCNRYTGVGRVTVRFNADGDATGAPIPSPQPVLANHIDMGFPEFVSSGGINYLFYTQEGSVRMATADLLKNFVAEPEPVLEPGFADWALDTLNNPTVTCDAGGIVMYPGGRTLDDSGLLSIAGWGRATSTDGLDWTIDPEAYFEWSDDNSWRHWEVNSMGAYDHVVYHSDKDPVTGAPFITMMSTTPVIDGSMLSTRICP